MPIEAVVFDIGNVLIEWNPERFYDAQVGEERRKAMFAAIDMHAANDVIDAGGPFKSTFYDLADQHPEWGDEIRMWHDRWIEMAAPAIDHSVRLLRALRAQGVPVYALSNFGVETFAYAQTVYDFLGEFDRPYISGHMKVIKPDPNIYQMVEEDCGLTTEKLLFTDDRPDNIAAAAKRGWQTHLFSDAQGWADRLVADGLLLVDDAK